MKKNCPHFLAVDSFVNSGLAICHFKKNHLFFTVLFLLNALKGIAQTNNYFGVSGDISTNVWSTNPAGPYTGSLNTTGGAIINFGNAATVTGATITIKGINATANVASWTGGGTLGTGGTVATINVASGVTLNMFSQAISTVAGTGFIKSGAGVLALSTGSSFSGGFTLTGGTIIVGGVNALGGNTLDLSGGIIAANADRDLSGKYPGGISIGGNVQFGDIAGLASNIANLSFNNNISLGATNRTLIMGNAGVTSLSGIISGSNGVSFNKNINGSGIFDIINTANTFTGALNIYGGQTRFAADGSFGNTANTIVIDGGQLLTNANFTILHNMQLGTTAGTGINVSSGILNISSIVADKTISGGFTKYGAGTLLLTNSNSYTGTTYIDPTGGTLQLNNPGGNTLPITNNVVINGGTFRISSNQTLNDLSLVNGNLVVDNGVTMTINGIFDYFQSGAITLVGTGKIAYGPAATLKYSGTIATTATALEFPASGSPYTVNSNNSAGVILPFTRTITGSLLLTTGTFAIGAGALLDLDGASLNSGGGYLAGNAIVGSTADLMVRGVTGGTVTLATNGNIGLRNVTVSGSRTVALNGTNNLVLSGILTIASGAVFDNGGESQLTNGGTPVINISGTFITRDLEGFSGTNTAIPVISPILNVGCTIEYGRTGNQSISIRPDYQNIRFTGGGIKTHSVANSITPIAGTVTIPDATTLDVANNTFGSIATNLTMLNGRFRVSGTGTKPDMDGTYSLSGNSVIEFYNSGTALNETIKGKSGLPANILYNQIEVTGNKVSNSNSNITLNANGVFRVKSGGSFEINDNSITAAAATVGQAVVVENNGIFLCGNNKGFNGFTSTITDNSSIHSNITNITLATGTPGSTISYTRTGDQPITIANGLAYSNLTLSGSGIKTAPPGTLNINGNLSKTTACIFEHNNGLSVFNNALVTQTISSAVAPIFTFYDITNSNTSAMGLDIASNIGIINTLALVTNSNLNLNSADITLRSTATTTASVSAIPASASIVYNGNGRFIVERYFPAARAWRLITSPLSSDNTPTTIFSQWQNNGLFTPGMGAFVTGPNPDITTNGLDDSNFDNYSLKSYQNNAFVNMGNTLTPLSGSGLSAANIGYCMFVRGDRNRGPDNTIFPNTNNTTLSSRGKLQSGTQTFPGYTRTTAGLRNFALIGNPYPSPVNFNNLTRVNLIKRFVVCDPTINQAGAFVYFDDLDNDGVYTIYPASSGGQDFNIQSSQAFFVETDAAIGPSAISFNESSKSAINNLGMFRPVAVTPSFKSSLYLVNNDAGTKLADGNIAEFNTNFNDTVDLQDALKFANVNETFSLQRNRILIAMERRATIIASDTLFFNLTRTTPRNYQFRFEPINLDPLLTAFLEDSYTQTSTPLSVTESGTYNFSVNDVTASANADRFRIVFKLADGGLLPVRFNFVKARQQGSSVAVEWGVENAADVIKYEVEKSIDGVNFYQVNTLPVNDTFRNSTSYDWLDKKPVTGDNFYRILSIDRNGKKEYSEIAKLKMGGVVPGISIYPNPVKDGLIGVGFKSMAAGVYDVKLLNNLGQVIFRKTISHSQGASKENIYPDHELLSGIYQIEITAPDKESTAFKVIIK